MLLHVLLAGRNQMERRLKSFQNSFGGIELQTCTALNFGKSLSLNLGPEFFMLLFEYREHVCVQGKPIVGGGEGKGGEGDLFPLSADY